MMFVIDAKSSGALYISAIFYDYLIFPASVYTFSPVSMPSYTGTYLHQGPRLNVPY